MRTFRTFPGASLRRWSRCAAIVALATSNVMVYAATQPVTLSKLGLSFGVVAVKTPSPSRSITLTNSQLVPLTISSIAAGLSDFASSSNCPLAPATLAAGGSCNIYVTFTPAALGLRTTALVITDNAATSPQHMNLTGTGVLPVTLGPTSVTFPNEPLGIASSSAVFTLWNNLYTPITISKIATSLQDFSSTTTCPLSPATLSARAKCQISVVFTPAVLGQRSATLNVTDASNASPAPVSLLGAGLPPVLLSIAVTPGTAFLKLSATQQFVATGSFSDGSTKDVTKSVSWSSTNSSVGTLNASGLLVAMGTGSASARASSGSVTGSATVQVSAGTVIPATFFGLDLNTPAYFPAIPFGLFRDWDSHASWYQINSAGAGQFNWAPLDNWLALLKQHGHNEAFFTFGGTPAWASSNPSDTACDTNTGGCWLPADIASDGSGTDATIIAAITAIAQHVNDPVYRQTHAHIKYWEPWNEWYRNPVVGFPISQPTWSVHATYAQMVRITEDIRCAITGRGSVNGVACTAPAVDPSAVITTSSCAFNGFGKSVMTNFLYCSSSPYSGSMCTTGSRGAKAVDIVNYHIYIHSGAPPENAVSTTAKLKSVLQPAELAKPLWSGEGGWGGNSELPSRDLQAAFVGRYFALLWSSGVSQAIWFQWDGTSSTWGTLFDHDVLTRTPAGVAFQQVYSWLAGATQATPQFCTQAVTIWTCHLARSGGYVAQLVWDSSQPPSGQGCGQQPNPLSCGATSYAVPAQYNLDWKDLAGGTHPYQPSILIGAKPILLEGSL